jgi:hypothetical protein
MATDADSQVDVDHGKGDKLKVISHFLVTPFTIVDRFKAAPRRSSVSLEQVQEPAD